jgi:hypothetical protein
MYYYTFDAPDAFSRYTNDDGKYILKQVVFSSPSDASISSSTVLFKTTQFTT